MIKPIFLKNVQNVQEIGNGTGHYHVTVKKGGKTEIAEVGALRGSILFTRYNDKKMSQFYRQLYKDTKEYNSKKLDAVLDGSMSLDDSLFSATNLSNVRLPENAYSNLSQKYDGKTALIEKTLALKDSHGLITFMKGAGLTLSSGLSGAVFPSPVAIAGMLAGFGLILKSGYEAIVNPIRNKRIADFLGEIGVKVNYKPDSGESKFIRTAEENTAIEKQLKTAA